MKKNYLKEVKKVIEVRNVSKRYGNFVAVDDISFHINRGEIVGFLGPNGAGKTTTMNMLTGFTSQTSGQIIINGYDTLKKTKQAKKAIGYMPENVPLYQELTVKEFINYMADLKDVGKSKTGVGKKKHIYEIKKRTDKRYHSKNRIRRSTKQINSKFVKGI